jgi:SnoaL-like domain
LQFTLRELTLAANLGGLWAVAMNSVRRGPAAVAVNAVLPLGSRGERGGVQALLERSRLQDRLTQFATAVDTLDLALYCATFSDECRYDVSSFNGAPPAVVKAADWAAAIEPMLRGFDSTQHYLSNFVFDLAGDGATVSAYVQAEHWLAGAEGGDTVTLGGRYNFHLHRAGADWKIDGFKLDVLWQRGNRDLYAQAMNLSAQGRARRPR